LKGKGRRRGEKEVFSSILRALSNATMTPKKVTLNRVVEWRVIGGGIEKKEQGNLYETTSRKKRANGSENEREKAITSQKRDSRISRE